MPDPSSAARANRSLCWFRDLLRLRDHLSLSAAAEHPSLLCLYILPSDEGKGAWDAAAPQQWWRYQSVLLLQQELEQRGQRLLILEGDPAEVLSHVADAIPFDVLFAARSMSPRGRAEEQEVERVLEDRCVCQWMEDRLLFDPEEIQSAKGGAIQVFTPFWKACLRASSAPGAPLSIPRLTPPPPKSRKLLEVSLPRGRCPEEASDLWTPGEEGAQKRWRDFLSHGLESYHVTRDLPGVEGTSRLGPHLHFGEISPRQIWHDVRSRGALGPGATTFLAEMGWREFAHHLLFHFPHTVTEPLRPQFASFPWRKSRADFQRWTEGQTGIPLIDAGMRELRATGWMHNRVRMNVASFLVKHLLLPWQWGSEWFWQSLLDADLANNTLGWQWSAGCGADAAPYFRVFNPVLQSRKFDPEGIYLRRWLPELAALPDAALHAPWEVKEDLLQACGVQLGTVYPHPIVDLKEGREAALAAFASLPKHG